MINDNLFYLSMTSYRLKQELERLVNDKCQKFHTPLSALQFRFHQPPAHPSTVAWVGGTYVVSNLYCMFETIGVWRLSQTGLCAYIRRQ